MMSAPPPRFYAFVLSFLTPSTTNMPHTLHTTEYIGRPLHFHIFLLPPSSPEAGAAGTHRPNPPFADARLRLLQGNPYVAAMPAVDIESVSVEFPFQPYPAQLTYMEKVVEALNKRTNALLESPTGTGKTLSLLCSTLAWQQSYSPDKDNSGFAAAGGCCGGGGGGAKAPSDGGGMALRYEPDSTALLSRPPQTIGGVGLKAGLGFLPGPQGKPVIVYASRTHSQLTQVVRELKATTYRPRTVILGSREQLCVHPEVSKLKGGLQNRRCGVLVGNRSCRYKNNLESFQVEQAGGLGGPGVMDIEELSELGRTKLVREKGGGKGAREGREGGCILYSKLGCPKNPEELEIHKPSLPPLPPDLPVLPDASEHPPSRPGPHAI